MLEIQKAPDSAQKIYSTRPWSRIFLCSNVEKMVLDYIWQDDGVEWEQSCNRTEPQLCNAQKGAIKSQKIKSPF